MKKQLLQVCVLLIGLAAGGFLTHRAMGAPQSAPPPGGQTVLLARLQDLVSQLRQQRQAYYRQKALDEAEVQKAQQNRDLLQSQLNDLRTQEADLDRQLEDYREQAQTLVGQLEHKATVRSAVDQEIMTFVSEQRSQIEQGIPYQQPERSARLRAGLADANESVPASGARRLGHLWSYAQEELRLAGSSETYTERAMIEDGILPYARYFRVGQLILGYVTEDGRQAAIWLSSPPGRRWQSLSNPGQVASIREAVEILDRQQAPRFVSLPIDAAPSPSETAEP